MRLEIAQKHPALRNDLVKEILEGVVGMKARLVPNQIEHFNEGINIAYTAVVKLNPRTDAE